METYQQFIKRNRPQSPQRQCEDAFVELCKKYKVPVDTSLIRRMTLNVGFDLLRQKYVLDKLNYSIGLFDLELQIISAVNTYYENLERHKVHNPIS